MRRLPRSPVCVAAMSALAGLAACATQPTASNSSAATENELMAADRAYEAFNIEQGYKAASLEFIDFDEAIMIEAGEGFLTGKADIMAERQLDTVPSPVHWKPIGAKVGPSGAFGMTWGTFLVDYETDTTGNYVTVWHKVNGEWKIITDVAVDDPVAE